MILSILLCDFLSSPSETLTQSPNMKYMITIFKNIQMKNKKNVFEILIHVNIIVRIA